MGQGFDRVFNQLRAVVHRDNLYPCGQAFLHFRQFGLHRVNGGQRVFARTHDDNAARHLAFAVELGDAAPNRRTPAHAGDVGEQHRHAAARGDNDLVKIVDGFQVAGGAYHIFRFTQFQYRAAAFLVGALDRANHLLVSDVQRPQPVWVKNHLILFHHPADAGHLRNIRYGFQFIFKDPVLNRPQVAEAMLAAFVGEHIFKYPADAGGIRPQRRFGFRRQAALDLAQVLQHAGARPVRVGTVLKQYVNVSIAEHGKTAHGFRPRHRQHGSGQRIGHLIFDNLRRFARIADANDHLGIGKIRQRVQRRLLYRPDSPGGHNQRRQQYQQAVAQRPADNGGNHGCSLAPLIGITEVTRAPSSVSTK